MVPGESTPMGLWIFGRKMMEAVALLVGMVCFWGGLFVLCWTPIYLLYIYISCDYGSMSNMASNVAIAQGKVTNVTVQHRSEVDEGQTYRWDEYNTSWVATVDGKQVGGVFADENIAVGTPLTFYYRKGDFSSRTLESPTEKVGLFWFKFNWWCWGWLAPAVVCLGLSPLAKSTYHQFCSATQELERFHNTPRRPPVARIKLIGPQVGA